LLQCRPAAGLPDSGPSRPSHRWRCGIHSRLRLCQQGVLFQAVEVRVDKGAASIAPSLRGDGSQHISLDCRGPHALGIWCGNMSLAMMRSDPRLRAGWLRADWVQIGFRIADTHAGRVSNRLLRVIPRLGYRLKEFAYLAAASKATRAAKLAVPCTPNGSLPGSYRIATAPEPNSNRLTATSPTLSNKSALIPGMRMIKIRAPTGGE
jgi:hypothetical protein